MRHEYEVQFTQAAEQQFAALDNSDQALVVKQLEKLQTAPELGQPLRGDLVNHRKMYAAKKRLRIVYRIEHLRVVVTVIAIGKRENEAVYRVAEAEAAHFHQRRLRRIS